MNHVFDYNVGNYKGEINDYDYRVIPPYEIRAVRFEKLIRETFHLNPREKYDNKRIQ